MPFILYFLLILNAQKAENWLYLEHLKQVSYIVFYILVLVLQKDRKAKNNQFQIHVQNNLLCSLY